MTEPVDFKYAGRGYIAYAAGSPANDASCIIVEDDPGVYERFLQDLVNDGICGFAASVPFSDRSCELLITGQADFGEHEIVLPNRQRVCLIVDLHNEAPGMDLDGYEFASSGREAGLVFYEKVARHLYPVPGFFATRFARDQLQLDSTVKTWGYVEVSKQIRPAGLERQTYRELYSLVQHIAARLVDPVETAEPFEEFACDDSCRATRALDHSYAANNTSKTVYRWDIAFRRQEFPLADSPYLRWMFDIIKAGPHGIGIQDLYERNCTKQINPNAHEVDSGAAMEAIRSGNDSGDCPPQNLVIDPNQLYNEEVVKINTFLRHLANAVSPKRYQQCPGAFLKEVNGLVSAQRGTPYEWTQEAPLDTEAVRDLDAIFHAMLAGLEPETARVPAHLEEKVKTFCREAETDWPMTEEKWAILQEEVMGDDFLYLRRLHEEIVSELSPLIGKLDLEGKPDWQVKALHAEFKYKALNTEKILAGQKPNARASKKKLPNPAAESSRRWQERLAVHAAKHSPDFVDYINDAAVFVKETSRWFYRGAEQWTIES